MSDTWVATDGLGRTLPGYADCGPPRPDKVVTVFYFTWFGPHGYDELYGPTDEMQGVLPKEYKEYKSPYDVTKILAQDPAQREWGPRLAFHHWGEPEMGYYLSDDEYVIRKQAQMLCAAGVDVLIVDATNGYTYTAVYMNLLRVLAEIRGAGECTPQIAFMAHTKCEEVVPKLYRELYAKNLYRELWFEWKGKPLILAFKDGVDPEILNFFTVRECWAWSNQPWFGDGRDKWTYLDNHPQQFGWHDRPDRPEQISVTPAQHAHTNIGRSFHNGRQPPSGEERTAEGLYFAEQWQRALEVDPEVVFVVDWNSWMGQRFVHPEPAQPKWEMFLGEKMKPGDTWFVDDYDQEHSRTIEPMKGGHGDTYYYQMVANIRRYKGVRPNPTSGPPKSIAIDGRFDDWSIVTPEYRDAAGDTFHRNHPGWGRIEAYKNDSGRNDIVTLKVARDSKCVYFFAETAAPLTPSDDSNWMLLFIDIDSSPATGWEGYDFVVNEHVIDVRTTQVRRLTLDDGGQVTRENAGTARYATARNKLELAVPRAALGIPVDRAVIQFDFHWADNVQARDDITEFALHGDSAPDRRFNYRYQTGP